MTEVVKDGDGMKLLEQFILGKKNDPSLCEDGIVITDNFIAVLDGVTAKSNRTFWGKSGGRAAMEAARAIIEISPAITEKDILFRNINKAIRELYDGSNYGEAAVCVCIYSRFFKEIWSMGDCQYLVNEHHYCDEKEIDTIYSRVRAAILEKASCNGSLTDDKDPGRQYIMPLLKNQHLFANSNTKYSYPLLNGSDFDTNRIISTKVCDGDTVILATDGYPKLFDTLKESESYLAYVIENDPMCYKIHISTKGIEKGNVSFDDRAYVKFVV